ncbi:GFA family protein [Pseudooceanicola sp. C21-150M6]|uniref:GFA family protein n=1 Tax=Pseudooceanicola sp. C21-150M6 TaxID=3434355 RepID=UPI003D7FBED3
MSFPEKSGGCLCGRVRFTARNVPEEASLCHCELCRRWTGSALVGVALPIDNVTWSTKQPIATGGIKDWAERAWCDHCGSHLWFRVTEPGPWSEEIELPLGLFDDPSGFTIAAEIYIDHKPDSYAYRGAEDRKVLTRADCVAAFPTLAEA